MGSEFKPKKKISTQREEEEVATIPANNDQIIGQFVADANDKYF